MRTSFRFCARWTRTPGEPRLPQPTYIDAVNVLHQLGCYASVDVVWVDMPRTFDSLDEAIERFGEAVAVSETDVGQRERLARALEARLQPLDDGRLAMARRPYPIATVWWEAGALKNA